MNNRKVCIVAVLILVTVFTTGLHAQEQGKNNQLSFGAACLVALSDNTVSVGPSIQVSWLNPSLFTDFLGLGIHFGLIMPIGQEIGYGATLIIGPSMTVFNNGTFRIPITLGVHADHVVLQYPDLWVWNVGAGAVADFVWQFGKKWYAYSRVQAAFNFGAFEFLITPGLGMGISR
jgi:hypothetical protein